MGGARQRQSSFTPRGGEWLRGEGSDRVPGNGMWMGGRGKVNKDFLLDKESGARKMTHTAILIRFKEGS